MAGHSRPKDGVASARLCPGHPRLSFLLLAQLQKDVDARHKAGHDELCRKARILKSDSEAQFV
jgi:A/G-specific adenine glycosylase